MGVDNFLSVEWYCEPLLGKFPSDASMMMTIEIRHFQQFLLRCNVNFYRNNSIDEFA